jgi:dipeptidase E
MKRLLLISNSTNVGEPYLGWPRPFISAFLEGTGVKNILFIPYAGVNLAEESLEKSYDVYEKKVQAVFGELGYGIYSIHREKDPLEAVRNAQAIAVGGGNTFHLVYELHRHNLVGIIREKSLEGMHYMGWSAGANVACPTLRTTNDMPIVQPASFDTFNLVPFQINPHYLDANPAGHGGETRQQRIEEFLAVNRGITVVGLREASLIQVEGERYELKGSRPVRIFRYGKEAVEKETGRLDDLMIG